MVIKYSVSFQMLQQYIEHYNGQQEEFKTRVRQAMTGTAKELIRIYGVSLIKAQKIKALDMDSLPSLRTNNQQLATITGASGRTIQRHINRLLDAKILLQKVWHGSNGSYELWINPKVLWISGHGTVHKPNAGAVPEEKLITETQILMLIRKQNVRIHTLIKKLKKIII